MSQNPFTLGKSLLFLIMKIRLPAFLVQTMITSFLKVNLLRALYECLQNFKLYLPNSALISPSTDLNVMFSISWMFLHLSLILIVGPSWRPLKFSVGEIGMKAIAPKFLYFNKVRLGNRIGWIFLSGIQKRWIIGLYKSSYKDFKLDFFKVPPTEGNE